MQGKIFKIRLNFLESNHFGIAICFKLVIMYLQIELDKPNFEYFK